MNERADDDLLQQALDGAVDDAEAAQLDARLHSDPAIRARAEQLRRLAELVEDQEPAEPPPAFVDHVMEAIATGANARSPSVWRYLTGLIIWGRQRIGLLLHNPTQSEDIAEPWMTGWAGGGAIVAKKALWAVAGLALVVVLGVIYYNGTRSVTGGAEGTIGAANRYRGAQPTSRDVAAEQAAAQQFLQSDLFDRLVKDKNLRSLLADDSASQLLSRVPKEALRNQEAWALWRRAQAALNDSPEALEALRSPGLRSFLAELQTLEGTHRASRVALEDPAVLEALRATRLKMANLSDDQYLEALRAMKLNAVALAGQEPLESLAALAKFKAAMADDRETFVNLVRRLGFREDDDKMFRLAASPNALKALESAEMVSLFRSHAAFLNAFDNQDFAALAQNRLFIAALNDSEPLMMEALRAENLQAALKSQEALKAALRARAQAQ